MAASAERPPPRGEWVSLALARRAARGFARGWRAQPWGAIRGWWVDLGWLLAGALAAVAAMCALAAWAERRGWLGGEAAFVAGVERWPLAFGHALVVDALGSPFLLFPLAIAAAGAASLRERPLRALTLLATYPVLSLAVVAGWAMWDRARPTALLEGAAAPPGFNAFPSGHTAQAASVYGTLAGLWIVAARTRGERAFAVLVAVGLVAAVAVARLRLGVHWPSDVAAGAVLGAGWCAGSLWMLRRAERRGGR